MKNYVLLVYVLILSSCQKDNSSFFNPQKNSSSNNVNSSGYICINGNCVYASNNAKYIDLSTCQKNCQRVSIIPGMVKVYWANPSPWNECKLPCKVTLGFGYNSNDVNVEAYFQEGSSLFSGDSFSANNLAPGFYYYKAKKNFNSLQYGKRCSSSSFKKRLIYCKCLTNYKYNCQS
jgi:hypothetical protein